MKEELDSIDILESQTPRLSVLERDALWERIKTKIPTEHTRSVPSPFVFSIFSRHIVVPVTMIVLLVLGGGTAYASDASRPGDLLFPLERTLEDIRLRLARSEESKIALTQQLTEERLRELREIIDEELVVNPSNAPTASVTQANNVATTTRALEIEVHVYTDVTVVKLELNDLKYYFELEARTREDVVSAVVMKFPLLNVDEVDAQIDFEIEDRMSRPKDRGVVSLSSDGEVRVNQAVEAILKFLDETGLDTQNREELLRTLSSEVSSVTEVRRHNEQVKIDAGDDQVKIRVDDDGDSRIEIRDGSTRVRIEEKNGEVKVKKAEYGQIGTSSREMQDDEDGHEKADRSLDIEADVYTDITIVQLEIDDDEFTFETDADTRSGVIAEIYTRFPVLTQAQIDAELDLEIKDRVRRVTEADTDDEDGDDSSEHERGESEDDSDHEREDSDDSGRDDEDHSENDSDRGGHGGRDHDEDD